MADETEQVLAAEQDERRRIALFLHDGPVQSLAGVALMLDASLDLIERGDLDEARGILDRALIRTRATVGELRDLSFNLEPVVLRDHGFGAALDALGESRAREHEIDVTFDVAAVDALGEREQAALYQIAREALEEAIRRAIPEIAGVQTHLEPLTEVEAGEEVDADGEALVRRVVRDATGSDPRELRFLHTDSGLVAFLTLGLDGASRLDDAHARASEIEERIRRERPDIADVIVHTEP